MVAETMKAWVYDSAQGGIEKNMVLHEDAPRPPVSLNHQQSKDILVEVISMSVNPIDYKIPDLGFPGRMMIGLPATPGLDYCGRITAVGSAIDSFRVGELVFGRLDKPCKFGTLGQYVAPSLSGCVPLPVGIDPDVGCTLGNAAGVAYQCIVGRGLNAGDKVFINGGSGGVGTFLIQFAKMLGCEVTTTCSTANVELCKNLGADKVIDYKTTDVVAVLKEEGQVYALCVDNAGEPFELYPQSEHFLLPGAKFLQMGGPMSFGSIRTIFARRMLPGFVTGGRRPFEFYHMNNDADDYARIAKWVKEGKVKPVIDSVFEYEDAPKAYEKLRGGRAKGKIIVHVTPKSKA